MVLCCQLMLQKVGQVMGKITHALIHFQHLRNSLLIILVCCCCFGLRFAWFDGVRYAAAAYMLSHGASIALSQELIYVSWGLEYGLGRGLVFGLSYWFLAGLYRGVTQEHLADRGRRRFNQGIHRSLRNSALLGLVSSVIITLTALLLNSSWLNDGMSEPSTIWLAVLCGWLIVWAASGGLTILRHYLLRVLLALSYTFPWQAQHFLDDACTCTLLRRVGGGYSFMHRLLLDHFADLTPITSSAPVTARLTPPPSPERLP